MNQDDIQAVDAVLQRMQWGDVSLSPSPEEVAALDQQLPADWLQLLEQEPQFSKEALEDLLRAPLDIPEGDIDANARQALRELDIDVEAIIRELDHEPPLDIPKDVDHNHDDFGR